MSLQAVHPWRLLEIADVGVFAVVAIFTARALRRPLAAGGSVEVVTDIVTLELGAPALWRRAAPRRRAATASARTAPPRRRLMTVLFPAAAGP